LTFKILLIKNFKPAQLAGTFAAHTKPLPNQKLQKSLSTLPDRRTRQSYTEATSSHPDSFKISPKPNKEKAELLNGIEFYCIFMTIIKLKQYL
jgi:hypothetical protein